MKIFDIVATSFGNLLKRKTRTLLTLLGVVLGSASVAMTFAIGDAVKQNNENILESTGLLRYIAVYTDSYNSGDSNFSSAVYLDDKFINKAKKINNVKCVFYTLRPEYLTLVAGKNDKYKTTSYSPIIGVDFEESEKFGLKLLDNSVPDFSNYNFKTSSDNIKVIGGQYFEYLFENTAASQNSGRGKGGPGGGPGGPGRKNNSSNRTMNSPVIRYMFSKWGMSDRQESVVPPFVSADKDNIFLAIQYPNSSSSSSLSLSEYDMDFDENNIVLENNNTDLYKYKKYKINLAGRYNWDCVKDNDLLANFAGNCVFLDINTTKTLIREAKKLNKETSSDYSDVPEFLYESVIIEANDIDHVLDITKEIKKMGYEVDNLMSTIENEQLRAQSNQFILGFLGCLALLVSTISISNTMITSVYERTKEIGIMKVLGCKIGNIQTMFLIESGVIGLFGGIIGVTSSYLLSNFMNKLVSGEVENMGFFAKIISNYIEGMKTDMSFLASGDIAMKVAAVDPKLCVLVILGTTLLGLIAGYFPSLIASRIEALRAIKTSK